MGHYDDIRESYAQENATKHRNQLVSKLVEWANDPSTTNVELEFVLTICKKVDHYIAVLKNLTKLTKLI
jgi:hypothetical protein